MALTALVFFLVAPLPEARADGTPSACPGAGRTAENHLTGAADDKLRALAADFLLDPTGALGAGDIAAQAFTAGPCGGLFTAPRPGQALWLRFMVVNDQTIDRQWVVTFLEFIFDEVTLFEARPEGLVAAARNGRTIPIPDRADTAVKTGFPLDIAAGQEKTFYLRIAGTFAPTVSAALMSPELFADWTLLTLVMTAVFLGYVGTIALISVILFRHVEARFYRYYALYMACFFAFSFIYDGWLSNFMGVTLPVTVLSPIREFIAGLGVFANIQYCRVLLTIDRESPRLKLLFTVLSGLAVVVTGLAVVDPWGLSLPLHLVFFASPLLLLVVAVKKIRDGLPQAKAVAGSLLCLSLGLCAAVYGFMFPLEISQASAAYDLIVLRPLTWGYYSAIMGETTFMMLAISIMVKAIQTEQRAVAAEAEALRDKVADTENQVIAAERRHAEMLDATDARIRALEASLLETPEKNLQSPAEQRFLEAATECTLERLGDPSFGAKELAAALGTSEKTLGRRLKESHGLSPAAFIRSVRLNFARDLILLRQHGTVAEVARAAGFTSVAHFSKLYRQEFGKPPSESLKQTKAGD